MTPANPNAYASGFYDAIVCSVHIDRDVLTRSFPPGLELVDRDNPRPDIAIMFGRHSHVKPWYSAGPGSTYLEWVAAVPSVRRIGTTPVFSLMSRLYLDHWWWVVMGWPYGYPKMRARIRRDDNAYAVHSLLANTPVTTLRSTPLGPLVSVPSSPDAPLIRRLFAQPFIGQVIPGVWIYSRMWFLLDQAEVAPVTATFTLEPGCVPRLPHLSFSVDGITREHGRAFHLRVPWQLSRPYLSPSVPPDLE
jgi:hypothetical protein